MQSLEEDKQVEKHKSTRKGVGGGGEYSGLDSGGPMRDAIIEV